MQIAAPVFAKEDFAQIDHREITRQPNREARIAEEKVVQAESAPETLGTNISLRFSEDLKTGKLVVHMIDEKTGESIRQFPTDSALWVTEVLGKLKGKFIDQKV